jgi:hypothetical protein
MGRIAFVSIVGLALPYLARLPGCVVKGGGWLYQYLEPGLGGALLIEAFNLVAIGAAAGSVALFHKRGLWLLPTILGYGFLAFAHGTIDLASSSTAAIALVFIPFVSLPFFAVGALLAVAAKYVIGVRRGARRPE